MLESGGEKTQLVPQKQRKNACMAIILLLTIITVGGCVGEMVFDGIISGDHMINNAYAEESVLLVTNEIAMLLANDTAARDSFGGSVSVYNNTAVIGAYQDDDNGDSSGSAYVFEKNSNGNWTQKQKLLASDGEANDNFGDSVSVYNNTAVIGAYLDDDNGFRSGSAYVFEKNSTGNWTQKAKLLADDGAVYDFFGYSVSVYNNTAVIGANGDYGYRGSAYVFEKNSTGHWPQKAKLLADDGAANDGFGDSVSVYNNTAVIGAASDDDNGSNFGSAYVFEKNSTGHWTQKAKLLASDGAAFDYFGDSVSVYNNTAVIGADFDDDKGSNSGSAYVFEKNSTGHWPQKAKLLADDGAANDFFGYSVSVYNNTAVIGAYFDDGDDDGSSSGSAYVFEKNSTGHWTQKQKLLASDGAAFDNFGGSVSVYNNTAVIGADFDDGDDDGPASGSAYVFEKNSSATWTQKAKLLASDTAVSDNFGYSVSVYNNTAVIGAYRDDSNGSDSGSAYVFEKNSSGNWTQKAKLLADDGAANDGFGDSVSVYNNTAVIGAYFDDDKGSDSGSAYVFEKNSSGNWTQKAKLLASDGEAFDWFGYSVSLSSNTAVIGASADDNNNKTNSGSAYVFEYSSGNWTQKAKLVADDADVNDYFGYSVSVYNNTAVIGAYRDDSNGSDSGSAYVFEYSSATWTQKAKLVADDADADDYFGYSISVYNNTAVIGASADDNNNKTNSGSAYVFEKNSTSGNWTQKAKLLASDGAAFDNFGGSVSVYNNTAIIGAFYDDDNGFNSGSAYVFEKNSTSGNWTQTETVKLTASDAAADDRFGYSVSVYNNTAVIGAHLDDDNGLNSGSAYVFSVDTTAPTIASASVTNATRITVAYDDSIDVTTTDGSGFTLSKGTVTANTDPGGTGNSLILTVSGITTADVPDVIYTATAGTVVDDAANAAADQTFTGTTDDAPPTVDSAATSDTTTIKLTLSEDVELSDSSANISANFTLSGDITNSPAVSSVSVSENIVTLGLDNTLDDDDTISVAYAQGSDTIDDVSANSLASFGPISVTNNIADTTAPEIASASVTNATRITVAYDDSIDVTTTDGSGFTLSKGTVTANTDPGGTGNSLILTVSGITTADVPDVIYTATAGTVVDDAANAAADQTFTGTTDDAPPTVDSAATSDTTTIKLTLSEDVELSDSSANISANFTLSGDITNSPAVSSVSVSENIVTLGLDNTLDDDDTISVAYAQGSDTIDDVSANSLASFGPISVTNNIADTTAPEIASASVTNATRITVAYDDSIDVTTTDGSGFTLSKGTVTANTDPGGTGNSLILTVSGITTADVPDVIYTATAGTVVDDAANAAADQTFTGTTDDAPPTVDSAATSDTTTIKLTLSEDVELSDSSANISANFTLSGEIGNSPAVSSVSVSENIVTLGLDNTLDDDDTISVAYAQGSDTIDDVSANSLASFGPISVTNNIADTTAPTIASASVTNATRITVTYDDSIDVRQLTALIHTV